MGSKKIQTLEDLGEAAMLVSDFKAVKDEYFRLKKRHRDLIAIDDELVNGDSWSDRVFEEEAELFERRRQLYAEAQELFRQMRHRLNEK